MKVKFYFIIMIICCVQSIELRSQSYHGVINLGEEGNNYGHSIKHDDLGNFYVTGEFDGTALFDEEVIESHGDSDIFLAKFNNLGKLVWIKTAGGASSDKGYSLSVSPDNKNVCISGFMSNASFGDTTVTTSPYFLANYDSSGHFNWVRTITCNGGSAPKITYGNSGDVYLTGPTTNVSNYINSKYYMVSYDSSGAVKWIKTAIGDSYISPTGIAVDNFENIYVFGGFQNGSINFGDSVLVPTSSVDAFLLKYDSSGTLIWSKMFACEGVATTRDISVDNMNNVYLVGSFENKMEFDDTTIQSVGDNDAYILKYNGDGNLIWARTAGGEAYDIIEDCTTDSLNNLYITGKSSESASFNELISNNEGMFVAKYDMFGNILFLKNNVRANSFWGASSRGISVNNSSEIFLTGNFSGSIMFDSINLSNEIGQNIFIAKLSEIPINSIIDAFTEEIYFGTDSNFVGSSIVDISIPNPTATLGHIEALEWIFNGKVIGEGNSLSYEFPVGTNELILKTISSWGTVQYDTTEVSVYSSTYSRNITNYNFIFNNKMTPSSNINNGEFVLSNFNSDLYLFRTAIVDSTFNLSWLSDLSTPFSIPCLIDNKNILYTSVFGFTFLYTDSLSNNYLLKEFSYENDQIPISPSYSVDSLLFIATRTNKIIAKHIKDFNNDLWEYQCDDSISSHIVINENGDLIFGSSDDNLYSLKSDGELRWKYNVNANIESTPAICIDSTIIFGSNNGYLYKISNEGNELWKYKTDGLVKSSPVIDFYGNIYFGSTDGYFYALSTNGELNWKFETSGEHEISASIGNNGYIYVIAENNIMYVFDKTGNIIWYFKFISRKVVDKYSNHINEKLQFAPLITDNNLIFLRTNLDQYFILKDPSNTISENNYLPQWPTFKGNNRRTGSRFPNAITSVENKLNKPIADFRLDQNFPNPFNPITTIKYQIPNIKSNKEVFVDLKIYDLLGREIMALVKEKKIPGEHEVYFDASNLTSGIYFYRFQVGEFMETKKMILIK